jgi:hypothetical protein
MSYDSLVNKPRQRASAAKKPLVVRGVREDAQTEMVEKLARMERSLDVVQGRLEAAKSSGESGKFDPRALVALCAIVVSVAGYVIQDARNSSRQDAEIESTKVRVTNLEKIATTNTEARIRTEVELQALRAGQDEIKLMITQHERETRKVLGLK